MIYIQQELGVGGRCKNQWKSMGSDSIDPGRDFNINGV